MVQGVQRGRGGGTEGMVVQRGRSSKAGGNARFQAARRQKRRGLVLGPASRAGMADVRRNTPPDSRGKDTRRAGHLSRRGGEHTKKSLFICLKSRITCPRRPRQRTPPPAPGPRPRVRPRTPPPAPSVPPIRPRHPSPQANRRWVNAGVDADARRPYKTEG
eukprot:222229-Prorocentrum_minimum.AAC.3